MMMRWFYLLLLRLHPRWFRDRFSEEMTGIFDEAREDRAALFRDALVSLGRQWVFRSGSDSSSAAALAPTYSADGAPLFFSCGDDVPRHAAIVHGAFVSLLAFTAIYFVVNHRWAGANWIIGSHHPSPSHILGAPTKAVATTDLPTEIKLKPYPDAVPIPPYFRLILVLGALDTDRDAVISAQEIADAYSALQMLDKNHDGKLSAEECGARFGDPARVAKMDPEFLRQARLAFMSYHPVLAALDANHDGEISKAEMKNAPTALRTLDANGDGKLTLQELLPN